MSDKKLSITLMKSKYGRLVNHQNCILGLGLKKYVKLVLLMIHRKFVGWLINFLIY